MGPQRAAQVREELLRRAHGLGEPTSGTAVLTIAPVCSQGTELDKVTRHCA